MSLSATVLASELNTLITSALTTLQTDNAQVPLGLEQNFFFANINSSTTPANAQTIFVAPFDLYVEALCVQCGNFTNPSTVTVNVTGDGALSNFPLTATGSIAAAGTVNISRRLLDNTKTSNKGFAKTSQMFRVFTTGETITITVSTTSLAAATACMVTLAMRQFFARDSV
jgi:hypothetical protein